MQRQGITESVVAVHYSRQSLQVNDQNTRENNRDITHQQLIAYKASHVALDVIWSTHPPTCPAQKKSVKSAVNQITLLCAAKLNASVK